MTIRQLTRSSDAPMISGVCAGLGRYFEIDATLVRVAFVLLVFLGGIGLIAYLVLALLMPAEGAEEANPGESARRGLQDLAEGVGDLAAPTKAVLHA